jgi:hypothetical protein
MPQIYNGSRPEKTPRVMLAALQLDEATHAHRPPHRLKLRTALGRFRYRRLLPGKNRHAARNCSVLP